LTVLLPGKLPFHFPPIAGLGPIAAAVAGVEGDHGAVDASRCTSGFAAQLVVVLGVIAFVRQEPVRMETRRRSPRRVARGDLSHGFREPGRVLAGAAAAYAESRRPLPACSKRSATTGGHPHERDWKRSATSCWIATASIARRCAGSEKSIPTGSSRNGIPPMHRSSIRPSRSGTTANPFSWPISSRMMLAICTERSPNRFADSDIASRCFVRSSGSQGSDYDSFHWQHRTQ